MSVNTLPRQLSRGYSLDARNLLDLQAASGGPDPIHGKCGGMSAKVRQAHGRPGQSCSFEVLNMYIGTRTSV